MLPLPRIVLFPGLEEAGRGWKYSCVQPAGMLLTLLI